jgi:hypothetical protein
MNWRRGFIRLWLVASVIWIAINGFAFRVPEQIAEITPWLRPMRLSDLASDPKDIAIRVRTADGVIHEFPAGTDQAVIDRTIKTYAEDHQLATAGYATLLPSDAKLDAPPPFDPSKPYTVAPAQSSPPGEQGPWTKYQNNPYAKYANEDALSKARAYAVQQRSEAMTNLRGFVFFGVGAPMAVLILGVAGWWIARGFRPRVM